MAADVSSIVRLMADYNKNDAAADDNSSSRELITRDFLGGGAGSKELDLDRKVPSGWERRLDLLSGETYLEKSGSNNPPPRELQDLNLPPPVAAADNSALDLKLLLRSGHQSFSYQSVCTLDKVRSALERAGRESQSKKNNKSDGSPSPSTSSTTSSSAKRRSDDQDGEEKGSDGSGLIAAGCPSCLLYVLISKGNPRCPRCDSHVPVTAPVVAKKPRLDLNSTT